MIYKAYKFRLRPNKEQGNLILKTIGSSRFVFNHFLDLWNTEYNATGKGLSYSKCSACVYRLKSPLCPDGWFQPIRTWVPVIPKESLINYCYLFLMP